MRKNLVPGKESRMNKISFSRFQNGTLKDPPASEIQDALADSTNLTIFQNYFEGRTGCIPYGSPLGRLSGRSGYSAHKEGANIVSDSGDIFTSSDVGQYFSFGSENELIKSYVDAQTVIGSDSVYRSGSNCGVIGMPDMLMSHKQAKKWVIATSGEIRIADIEMLSWISAACISNKSPGPSRMDNSEYRDWLLAFTTNGLYRVELGTFPISYQINISPPATKITAVLEESATHSYRYLYSATRISADNSNRQDAVEISIETGTNTPDDTNVDYSEVFTIAEISESNPQLIEELVLPIDSNDTPERHLTHYTIWRTKDLEGKDPDDVYKEKFNDPNRFVWVKDLRTCGAFYGTIVDSVFIATYGEFEACDVGSELEIEDGNSYPISEVTDSTHVTLTLGGDTPAETPTAAAIGGGRVLKGSLAAGLLTLTHGTLSDSDLNNTLFSSYGNKVLLSEIVDSTHARTSTPETMLEQGFTCNPVSRKFTDTVPDETLQARKDFYTCRNRFKKPLPNCNVGAVITGFLVAATRGDSRIYYSDIESGFSQFIGQYIPDIQTKDEIKDSIQAMWVFDGVLSVFCSTQTWGCSIGISEFIELPSSTELVAALPGFKLTDKHRGCLDIDSMSESEDGMIMLVTNEPGGEAMRLFDGIIYSKENYLSNRFSKKFNDTIKKSIAVYDGLLGYVLWRRYK